MISKRGEGMKKLLGGAIVLLSLIGIGYSGMEIFAATKGSLEKRSLTKDITKLEEKKKSTTTSLKEVTEKNDKLKKEYNKLREQKGIKVVYLTFDDGPTPNNTPEILKILKKNNIKATFFVIGQNHDMYKQIVNEGHAIAIHTYTHNYNEIYASVDAFFKDLYRLRDVIKEKTGVDPKVTRFPGGSSTTRASKALKTQIINRLTKEGYVYQDWNCDSRDASGNRIPVETLVKSSFCDVREVNLLMHDSFTKTTTVQALQQIIDIYKSKGYIFEVLTVDSPRFQHMKQPERAN